jgi:ABC-type siderophore export system fused ATPase/permease subunit
MAVVLVLEINIRRLVTAPLEERGLVFLTGGAGPGNSIFILLLTGLTGYPLHSSALRC